MAKPNFLRKELETGQVQRLEFTPEHFAAVGFSAELREMPILEAHQIVNQLNISQEPQRYVYALD